MNEKVLGDILTYANAGAALITMKKGAIRSMPDPENITKMIEELKYMRLRRILAVWAAKLAEKISVHIFHRQGVTWRGRSHCDWILRS